jgi:hypothetical protein
MGRLNPLLRIFFKALTNDAVEPGRNGVTSGAEIRWIFSQDRRHGLRRRVSLERATA